jgi:hypothetical protein
MQPGSLEQIVGQVARTPSQTSGLHIGLPALPAVSRIHAPVVQVSQLPPPQAVAQQTPATQKPLPH